MTLLKTAEEVSDVAFGFMASKALFTAIHFNLFSHLDLGRMTAQQAAVKMGIHVDRATTLMTALTTVGLLGRDGESYFNAPAAEAFLVSGAKYDFSDYLSQQVDRQMYGLLDQIEDAMADKLPEEAIGSYAQWMSDPEQARIYSESQHAGSLGPARTLARSLDLSDAQQMLDIGGGTGAYAITLCKENPSLKATVIDFPNVAELGEKYVADAGLTDRVNYVPGDLLDTDWPDGQDIVLMSYIFSSVPGERIAELVANAARVLKPGGRLIVHDFMVEPDRSGPKLAALWQFQHTAFNPHARSVSTDWAADTISAAGFSQPSVEPMIPGMTSVVSALRQAA
ncbi:MAG: methyltransferase [Burkholderiaceae bacterium]